MSRAIPIVGWAVILLWFLSLGLGTLVNKVSVLWVGTVFLLSLCGLALMVIDKRRAEENRSRISERTLLTLGALGGFPGIWFGIDIIRHKSSKPSFLWKFLGLTALHLQLFVTVVWLTGSR